MQEVIKTIDKYIYNIQKEIYKTNDYHDKILYEGFIDRLKKLKKVCENA